MLQFSKQCERCGECCKQGTPCLLREFEGLTYEITEEENSVCSLLTPGNGNETLCKVIKKYYNGEYNNKNREEIKNILDELVNGNCDRIVLLELFKVRKGNRSDETYI